MKAKVFSIDGRNNFANNVISELNEISSSDEIIVSGDINVEEFSDGEMTVQFKEYVRGHKVFLICSTNSPSNIMKLMLACDAARRASADEVVAIIPYYGYSRQDRKDGLRGAVGAKVVANMLVANGADRLITIDLHAEQIQGFFNMPVDHISGWNIFLPLIKGMVDDKEVTNLTICSPDAGGVKRVNSIFKKLVSSGYSNTTMAMFSKMRDKPNEVARLDLIGDVKGRDVIIIDDIVDTAGTLCGTVDEIMKSGAKSVRAIITHGVLSGPAIKRIYDSSIRELIITDTLEHSYKSTPFINKISIPIEKSEKFRIISCAPQIARIINAVCKKRSANELKEYSNEKVKVVK